MVGKIRELKKIKKLKFDPTNYIFFNSQNIKTFKSSRWRRISLMTPSKISVARVLSWISSKIITEYLSKNGSTMTSRKSIPSVMYFNKVSFEIQSSNLKLYYVIDLSYNKGKMTLYCRKIGFKILDEHKDFRKNIKAENSISSKTGVIFANLNRPFQ